MIPMAIGGLQSGAQARNNGQSSGLLGGPNAIDGSTQSFWNAIDPGNISGHSSSGHVLSNVLDPGNVFGFNQAANPNQGGTNGLGGVPSVLPTLGAAYNKPQMPQGSFGMQSAPGMFNQMAAMGAGPTYMPSFNKGAMGSPMMPANSQMNTMHPPITMGSIPKGFSRV